MNRKEKKDKISLKIWKEVNEKLTEVGVNRQVMRVELYMDQSFSYFDPFDNFF